MAMGLYISFAGMLTYKNAQALRAVASQLPTGAVLLSDQVTGFKSLASTLSIAKSQVLLLEIFVAESSLPSLNLTMTRPGR